MMIGDQAVGKTALLVRYADKEFHEQLLPTIGIDFKIKVRVGCFHILIWAPTTAFPLLPSAAHAH